MDFTNISNDKKIYEKNNFENAVQLINDIKNSFPDITSEQIKNNSFPESTLSRNNVMSMLFPNVDSKREKKTYNATHSTKLKLLIKSGILVRNPDVDNNRDSRYFLNEKRLALVLRNIEKERQKIESIHLKQHDLYFQ